jgi:hypothetical protein
VIAIEKPSGITWPLKLSLAVTVQRWFKGLQTIAAEAGAVARHASAEATAATRIDQLIDGRVIRRGDPPEANPKRDKRRPDARGAT